MKFCCLSDPVFVKGALVNIQRPKWVSVHYKWKSPHCPWEQEDSNSGRENPGGAWGHCRTAPPLWPVGPMVHLHPSHRPMWEGAADTRLPSWMGSELGRTAPTPARLWAHWCSDHGSVITVLQGQRGYCQEQRPQEARLSVLRTVGVEWDSPAMTHTRFHGEGKLRES